MIDVSLKKSDQALLVKFMVTSAILCITKLLWFCHQPLFFLSLEVIKTKKMNAACHVTEKAHRVNSVLKMATVIVQH